MSLLTPAQTFDRIERAHAAWTRGGATIVVANAGPQGVRRVRYRLDLDGAGGATLRVANPAQGRYAATDQAYLLRGATLVGVDYDARETIRRPAPDRGSVGLRYTAVLGGLDDAVGFLASPEVRDRYLRPLRALSGWRSTPRGLVRRTTAAGKVSLSRLDLDPAGRLRAFHVAFPGSTLDWSFEYGPVRPAVVPAGLKRVEAFTARLRPPRYASPAAKVAVDRLLRAGGAVRDAIVRLDGASTLWLGGSRVRYESGRTGFAYDGRVLTVAAPARAYQGRSSRAAVIDYVAATLGAVDPLVRTFLVRAVPFAELFPPEARVRLVGTMSANGQACDVLDVASSRFHASIFARKRDGLPLSIETSVLDDRGNAVSTSRRTLEWPSLGTPLPRAIFALRLSSKPAPLPPRATAP